MYVSLKATEPKGCRNEHNARGAVGVRWTENSVKIDQMGCNRDGAGQESEEVMASRVYDCYSNL